MNARHAAAALVAVGVSGDIAMKDVTMVGTTGAGIADVAALRGTEFQTSDCNTHCLNGGTFFSGRCYFED